MPASSPPARRSGKAGRQQTINFTVDAALLRELGERLVGRPHIALAELIKNSYDADASLVTISVTEHAIEVSDNGHGMTFKEFERFWMRIGSPHKERQSVSRGRHRPLTGSKGVGRLAVQFLATDLVLETRAQRGGELLTARVDWAEAVESVDLTSAKARYTSAPLPRGSAPFPGECRHGTSIRMSGLRHEWTSDDFVELAREIWALQPPFGGSEASDFRVELKAADENLVQEFDSQMRAWLHLWHARLRGRSVRRKGKGALEVELSVEFEGESPTTVTYDTQDACVHAVDFEIRVGSCQ